MLSRLSTSSLRQRSKLSTHVNQLASLSTVGECSTVQKAWEKSCYFKKDYTISEDSKVFEAVEKFAAYECGALITTDSNGKRCSNIIEDLPRCLRSCSQFDQKRIHYTKFFKK